MVKKRPDFLRSNFHRRLCPHIWFNVPIYRFKFTWILKLYTCNKLWNQENVQRQRTTFVLWHCSFMICKGFVVHLPSAWEVIVKIGTIGIWRLVVYVLFPCAWIYLCFPIYIDARSTTELTYESTEPTISTFTFKL